MSSLKSQVIPFILSTVHTVHTLEPRVTVLVNVRPAQTCHTLAPRVTDLVTVRESLLSILQQSLFWSLTAQASITQVSSLKSQVIPFILSTVHTVHTLEPRVTDLVNVRPAQTCHTLAPRVTDLVTVRESLRSILQQSLFWSLSTVVAVVKLSVLYSSSKVWNSLMKQTNGNGKKAITIAHWNLGPAQWRNKINSIQAAVDMHSPDLLYISEANLYEVTPPYETLISGYTITKPLTVNVHNLSRLVLLVRDGIDVTLETDLMDDQVTSIWVKLSRKGAGRILIGGVYREHRFLHQPDDSSNHPGEQLRRWNIFLSQVERASTNTSCHVIGDCNLDYIKWTTPDQRHEQMVTATKNTLETLGFAQLIEGATRSWPGQADSCIDHLWTNEAEKITSWTNLVKSVGDHNWIMATLRLNGKESRKLETHRRCYKNFDPAEYRRRLETIDWGELYKMENIDVANDFLESRILEIMDELCPMKVIQYRSNYKPWVTEATKEKMLERDNAMKLARSTGDPANWKHYRALRNRVNTEVDKDKKVHYTRIYSKHTENKDIGAIYTTAKNQVGWKTTQTPTSFQIDGKQITSPQEMADIQSITFHNKVQKLINDLPAPTQDPLTVLQEALENWDDKDQREEFNFAPITSVQLLSIIAKMNNSTSFAHDKLDSMMLKHGIQHLHAPIVHIINLSIRSEKFASRWKIGKILPLHKGKGTEY